LIYVSVAVWPSCQEIPVINVLVPYVDHMVAKLDSHVGGSSWPRRMYGPVGVLWGLTFQFRTKQRPSNTGMSSLLGVL
jgi:hypothetical protein